MKSIVIPILCCLAIIAACHRKSVPLVAGRTDIPPAPQPVAVTVIAASAEDIAVGKVIYTGKCARCHEAKPVQNWTVDQWKPILKSMIPNAKLDSVQKLQLTAYVNANAKP